MKYWNANLAIQMLLKLICTCNAYLWIALWSITHSKFIHVINFSKKTWKMKKNFPHIRFSFMFRVRVRYKCCHQYAQPFWISLHFLHVLQLPFVLMKNLCQQRLASIFDVVLNTLKQNVLKLKSFVFNCHFSN